MKSNIMTMNLILVTLLSLLGCAKSPEAPIATVDSKSAASSEVATTGERHNIDGSAINAVDAPIATATASTTTGDTSSTSQVASVSPTQEMNELQAKIAARQADLTRERDRNNRLRIELGASGTAGCMGDQRISTFNVEVYGSHLSTGNTITTGSAMQTTGNPGRISFSFSESFSVFTEDEESAQTFASPGHLTVPNAMYNNYLVRDIKGLKIQKGGVGYRSQSRQANCFFSCDTVWDNWETHKYSLTGIIIKINDIVFYRNMGIRYTFEGTNTTWTDASLGTNSDYIAFMANPNCIAGN